MAYELVYTSASKGLRKGSSGFCVVACTQGLSPRLIYTLEGLSAYKPLYPHYAKNAWDNPISRSHYLYKKDGEIQHVLSRVCFNGVDYTQRSNKLASHLVLNATEIKIAAGGPASLFMHEELFKDASWQIKAEEYSKQRLIPHTEIGDIYCRTWKKITGDAGWAGFLAQTYLKTPNRNVYLIYDPKQHNQIIYLISEALNLIPEPKRWEITFSSYFVNLPVGMECIWRCCPSGTEASHMARQVQTNIIIDLSIPKALSEEGELISAARSGKLPEKILKSTSSAIDNIDTQIFRQRFVVQSRPAAPKIISSHTVRKNPVVSKEYENIPIQKESKVIHSSNVSLQKIIFPAILIASFIIIVGGIFYFIGNSKKKQQNIESASYETEKIRDLYNDMEYNKNRLEKNVDESGSKYKQNSKQRQNNVSESKKNEEMKTNYKPSSEPQGPVTSKKVATKTKSPKDVSSTPQQNLQTQVQSKLPISDNSATNTRASSASPEEDPSSTWMHNLGKEKSIDLFFGKVPPKNIKIIPIGSTQIINFNELKAEEPKEVTWMKDDSSGYNFIRRITFSKSLLKIENKDQCEDNLPEKDSLLFEIKDKEDKTKKYPMFFLLGTSKCTSQKVSYSIKFNNGEISVTIKGIKLPQIFFVEIPPVLHGEDPRYRDIKNSECEIVLKLEKDYKGSDKKKIEIKEGKMSYEFTFTLKKEISDEICEFYKNKEKWDKIESELRKKADHNKKNDNSFYDKLKKKPLKEVDPQKWKEEKESLDDALKRLGKKESEIKSKIRKAGVIFLEYNKQYRQFGLSEIEEE